MVNTCFQTAKQAPSGSKLDALNHCLNLLQMCQNLQGVTLAVKEETYAQVECLFSEDQKSAMQTTIKKVKRWESRIFWTNMAGYAVSVGCLVGTIATLGTGAPILGPVAAGAISGGAGVMIWGGSTLMEREKEDLKKKT